MRKKKAYFQSRLLPVAHPLKSSIAASIGRTVTRHSYLEWVQAKIIHKLMEISIKQGRLAVRVPPPGKYGDLVQNLLEFQKITIDFSFNQLGRKLERADRARNALAHSVYIKDGDKTYIQLVTGAWEFPQDVLPVKRALVPETPLVNRAFLDKQRKAVEAALKAVLELQRIVQDALHALHEKRRTANEWNRRL